MLSLSSLLNPISISDPRQTDSATPSYYSNFVVQSQRAAPPRIELQEFSPKSKMSKDGAVFSKGKIKGRVVYPPFEKLDQNALRAVRKFKVYPFGDIAKYPRHIPYNSEKKSFLEKTGRESFEVFQYTFQVPNDEKEYTVMWDYNVGLVRITPFFKCCKYSKTSPAKMLNMNPGLKDITHSITGGALAAQGYWMPYACARAICATFCAHISGALIPLFGPSFPSLCVPLESSDYGRHVISSAIIKKAAEEANNLRSSLPPSDSRVGGQGGPGGPTSHPYDRQKQQQRSEPRQMPTPNSSTTTLSRFDSLSPKSLPSEYSISRSDPSRVQHDRSKRVRILRPNGHIEYSHSHTDSESSILLSERDRDREGEGREASTPMTSPALSYASSGWTPCNLKERMRQNNSAFTSNTSSRIASSTSAASHGAESRGGRDGSGREAPGGGLMTFTRELQHYATATPSTSPIASPWLSAIPREGPKPPALDLRNKLPPILRALHKEQEHVPGLGALGLGLRATKGKMTEGSRGGHEGDTRDKRSDGEYDADSDGSCPSPRAEKRRMRSRDLSERRQEIIRRERTPLPDYAPRVGAYAEEREKREVRRDSGGSGRRMGEEQERNAAVLALLSLSVEDRNKEEGLAMGHGVKRKRCASL